jgi:hypothetical protein
VTDNGKADTHHHRQQYLYGFSPIGEVMDHVRIFGTPDEVDRLPQLAAAWDAIRPDIEAVLAAEAGVSETIEIKDLPAEQAGSAAHLISSPLLQRGLSLRHSVAFVEIDKLIAAQRRVNLDYVERIAARLPEEIDLEFLVRLCLTPWREGAPVQHLQAEPGTHVFSSPSADLRFLGSFVKPLTAGDFDWAETGGIPAMAIISLVGYGDSPVNVLWSGARAVLNNGFHRVYALRQRGVRHIPVVLQFATDLVLEFPSHVVDLPREYLLSHPRPVLMKDFFDERFNTVLNIKNRLKTVTVRPDVEQREIPC